MSRKVILIIGASSDIGLDLIRKIDDDAIILAHYNSSNRELLELAREVGNELITLQADLSSEIDVCRLIEKVEHDYGSPDTIIHLAAPKFENARFKNFSWDKFQKDLEISFKSIVLILTKFLPEMAKAKEGKVVIMLSSVVVNVPPKALTQYTVIKYALLGLVKSLASEYSDKNVQINGISPSMIDTKFLANIDPRFVELNAYHHPLKRNALVGEVTPIIRMLISEESNYISGVNIPVSGGNIF